MRDALSRKAVVPVYALALIQQCFARPPMAVHAWHEINNAIADRWSWSAVEYIKREAWKMAERIVKETAA